MRKRTTAPVEPYTRRDSDEGSAAEIDTPLMPHYQKPNGEAKGSAMREMDQEKEVERSLIRSLVGSYRFRTDGLVKKTMCVSDDRTSYHVVSYYKVEDVKNNRLLRPSSNQRLHNISVCPELYLNTNFRPSVKEPEQYTFDGHMTARTQAMYSSIMGNYSAPAPGRISNSHALRFMSRK
ncbi:Global transcription regulator sge1 [Elasticomyces elasticus]|nr:Global transcription regulator sge1 [Elasticomyces elasticus]